MPDSLDYSERPPRETPNRWRGCWLLGLAGLVALVMSQLAQPPELLPPGRAQGVLLMGSAGGDFPRPRDPVGKRVTVALDLRTLRVKPGPRVNAGLELMRRDPRADAWKARLGLQGKPAVAADGAVAYVSPGRRQLVIRGPDGAERRRYRLPRVGGLGHPELSPDGLMVLYCYAHTTFLYGFAARVADTWGVAVLDLQTGRSYRVLPREVEGGRIWGVRDARAMRWVRRVDEPLG